jgi:catechol 2,3-dioxygenase-like lactoylglutathione lyase family enzyme
MTKPLQTIYLILYVNDLGKSRAFFDGALGLRLVEQDEASVKYDTGHVLLCLQRASDYGITLPTSLDHTTDIVFLVDDIEAVRAELGQRGVQLTPTVRYEIGAIADCYDPDGHWLTVYQPSDTAMGWPSGAKIRAILEARSVAGNGKASRAATRSTEDEWDGGPLDGKELLYLFLFVRDAEATLAFYRDRLGLTLLEGGPCSQGLTTKEDGVVKYDAVGILLATHHTEGTEYTDGSRPVQPDLSEHSCPPRKIDTLYTKGSAVVFHAGNIHEAVARLSAQGIVFPGGVVSSPLGLMAGFEAPSGHLCYLCEPSAESLRRPAGARLQQILAAPLGTTALPCRPEPSRAAS